MKLHRPKPLKTRHKPGDRLRVWDHALRRWYSATVIGCEPMAGGLYELLYVVRDEAKHKEGHAPNEDNLREGGAQLALPFKFKR